MADLRINLIGFRCQIKKELLVPLNMTLVIDTSSSKIDQGGYNEGCDYDHVQLIGLLSWLMIIKTEFYCQQLKYKIEKQLPSLFKRSVKMNKPPGVYCFPKEVSFVQ